MQMDCRKAIKTAVKTSYLNAESVKNVLKYKTQDNI